jgi:hypothetical protein
MNKIILVSLICVFVSGCNQSQTELSSSELSQLDNLAGRYKSNCIVLGVSSSAYLSIMLEKVSSTIFHSHGSIAAYDQNNCTGNLTENDVNNQPLPQSGIAPVTDIATIQTLLPGMPDKYILISNQPLDASGVPSGSPTYQVLYPINNTLYLLLIGASVTGTTWDEWKTSSAAVLQFDTDPEVSIDDGNGTVNAKVIKQ